MEQKKRKKMRGFTLVESMVFLLLFSMISIIFLETYATGTKMIIESKNRLGASALANQRMEIIRSIEYDDIGTKRWNGSSWVYGIPGGELIEDEAVSVNTLNYQVHTFVQYVDDEFDGQAGGSPNDAIPTDYKRVRVTVEWGAGGADQEVNIFGNFSPNGVETSSGGGVLSINVLDATGSGVGGASVRVVNAAASVDLTATTDSTGNVTLPGAPAGTQAYVITVSKSGYFGATTFPPYPTTAYNPVDVHASVVANVLNQKTIVMDQAADLAFTSVDPFGTAIPDIAFTLAGGRMLGTNPSDSSPVYGFTQSTSTDSSGEKDFAGQSYGQYAFTLGAGVTDYEFWKLSPDGSAADAFDAAPGSASDIDIVLMDKNIGSARVLVVNTLDDAPIAGADVKLSNAGLAYDVTRTTDEFGYAYFPEALPELAAGTYDIDVTASGYADEGGNVDVSGTLESVTIEMTPN